MIYVLAGNHREFLYYCRNIRQINPLDQKQVMYLRDRADEYKLHGVRLAADDEIIRYGTYRYDSYLEKEITRLESYK